MIRAATAGAPAAGVLIFDEARRLSRWTEGALRWLEVGDRGPEAPCILEDLIEELVTGERDADNPPARISFLEADRWIAAEAMWLEDGGIVVTIAPAAADQVVELLASRYGLTGREREIVDLLARGLDTRGVTQTLLISRHTLQDHLKSIFRKTGVHTRLKLVALVSSALSGQLHGP